MEGIVQGVGFRPFVYSLAGRMGLTGFVGNDARGVFVEVEGDEEAIARFLDELVRQAPPLAVVERVVASAVVPTGALRFEIARSDPAGAHDALVSPDIATCHDCLAEVLDPTDRRHRYVFTNCTNCGPRFTVVRGVPYDRPLTTMAGFAMCADCEREYHDPTNRRFHAQPTCCPRCGPSLRLLGADGATPPGDPLTGAVRHLAEGGVVAIKGLGGYHLAAVADDEAAVAALRSRKHREDKPFAVMAADVEAVRAMCHVGQAEERLLTSPRRPIVLLERRSGPAVAPSVALANRALGMMLPYTALHHLLARELARPFVLTSGNVSDEPIAYRDDEALERLAPIAPWLLVHDRPIHTRTDDSVARVIGGRELLLRRSRGYVPQPIGIPWAAPRPVLACGAQLKNTFCLLKERRAFVSHHIGDLENYETLRAFTEGIEHFRRLFDVAPEVVAHDLHPEYLSTKFALERDDLQALPVQHHHAHVVSCLADHGEAGPVVGIAFDGVGYGTDGTIWGGEVLAADLVSFERMGHLEAVPMPGGAAAIEEPWRMAAAYLDAAFGGEPPLLALAQRHGRRYDQVRALARSGVNSPLTSSAGRLYDAVAAILGVRDAVHYEGQAAAELEQWADPDERGAYPMGIEAGPPFRLQGVDLVRAVVEEQRAGVAPGLIAARFHNGLARAVVAAAGRVRHARGLRTVALSGGVFQNALLLERTTRELEEAGFRVLVPLRVPPNDGGISFGQAVVAAATDLANGAAGRPPDPSPT